MIKRELDEGRQLGLGSLRGLGSLNEFIDDGPTSGGIGLLEIGARETYFSIWGVLSSNLMRSGVSRGFGDGRFKLDSSFGTSVVGVAGIGRGSSEGL